MNLNLIECYCIKRFWYLNFQIRKIYKHEASLMESDAKNYIDLIRTDGQNSEGLHRTVQKQLVGSKPDIGFHNSE